MKSKKSKIWKLLSLTGTLGMVTAVPIIATACNASIVNPDNPGNGDGGDNNGGNGDNGGDNNGGNGDNGGDNNGGGSEVPKDDDAIDLVINNPSNGLALDEVIGMEYLLDPANGLNTAQLNDVVATTIQNSDELKSKLISNYDELNTNQKQNLEFKIESHDIKPEDEWGTNSWGYNQMSGTVYFNSEQLTIHSIADLKKQVETNLKKFLQEGVWDGGKYTESNSYSLQNGAQLQTEQRNGSYLKILVKENNKNNIELRIPTSDLNYSMEKDTLKVEGDSTVNNIEIKNINMKFDFGISNEPSMSSKTTSGVTFDYANSLVTNLNNNESSVPKAKEYGKVEITNVLKKIGWIDSNQAQNSSQFEYNGKLNNNVVAKSLSVFNADFGKVWLEADDGSSTNPSDPNYSGFYKLITEATPREGYYWSDGTKTTKKITVDKYLINLADATYSAKKEQIFYDSSSVFNNSTSNGTEDFKTFWEDPKNNEKLVAELQAKMTQDNGFIGTRIVFNEVPTNSSNDNKSLKFKLFPANGHTAGNTKSDSTILANFGEAQITWTIKLAK